MFNKKNLTLENFCTVSTLLTIVLGITLCSHIIDPHPKRVKKYVHGSEAHGIAIAFIVFWVISLLFHIKFGDNKSSAFVIMTALTIVTASMVLQDQVDNDTVELSKAAIAFDVICLVVVLYDIYLLVK